MIASQMPSATCCHASAASWSPRWAAAAALARALAWNREMDFDTLNVASQYRSGCPDLGLRLDQQLGAALGGCLRLGGEQRRVDVLGRAEPAGCAAETGLAGRVARVEMVAVERLEDLTLDDAAGLKTQLGDSPAGPGTGRLAALLGRREVVAERPLSAALAPAAGSAVPICLHG